MFAVNKVKALGILIGFLISSGCASLTNELLKNPEVSLSQVEVTRVSLKDVSLNFKLNVKNPNPIPLNLDQVSYMIKLSGQKVTEGVFDKGIQIPASGEGEMIVPLKFEYNAVGSLIDGFMKKTLSRQYEIAGSAKLGFFSIPFSKNGEINLDKR